MKVTQPCPTICYPMDCIVRGILQARVLEFPSPGDLPNLGIEPRSPHCRQILYQLSHQGSPSKGKKSLSSVSALCTEPESSAGSFLSRAQRPQPSPGTAWESWAFGLPWKRLRHRKRGELQRGGDGGALPGDAKVGPSVSTPYCVSRASCFLALSFSFTWRTFSAASIGFSLPHSSLPCSWNLHKMPPISQRVLDPVGS